MADLAAMLDLPMAERLPALARWYASEAGQRVWRNEQRLLDHHLPQLFGYHLMTLGVSAALPLAAASPIHHRFAVAPAGDAVAARAAMHALPIDTESVDVAVLHHCLDYSEDPHQLLRETARVLMPYGHVLVFGFQRWSALGLQHALAHRWRGDAVSSHRFIALHRLHDWLKLLDFEIVKSRHTVFIPPQCGERTAARLGWFERLCWGAQPPFGSVYFVLARKTVAGVHPLPAPWEQRRRRNPLAALAPQPAVPRQRRETLH